MLKSSMWKFSMWKSSMLRFSLVALFCLTPLLAQTPRGYFAWWDSPLVRDLNLTDGQVKQIHTTLREYRRKLVDLRASVVKADLDVEEVFNDDSVDPKRANEAIERLANSRADLTRALSQMVLKLRSVLTQEQWRELQKRRPRLLQNGNLGPGTGGKVPPRKQ